MTEPNAEILRRWLTAEQHDAAPAAEQALRELLVHLPAARPRRGFARRVTAAAALPATPAPFVWPLRALAGVCLLLTASAVACLPPLVALAGDKLTLAGVISTLSRAFAGLVDHLATVAAIGKIFGALFDAALLVATAPPVAVTWLATLVVSTLTLRWLVQLLSRERYFEHAPAH